MRKIAFLVVLVYVFNYSNCQELVLNTNDPDQLIKFEKNPVKDKSGDEAEARFIYQKINHSERLSLIQINGHTFFNDTIEKKYQLFLNLYSQEVPIGPGSAATRTVIEKPVIYSAITKLYKYYKIGIRKGAMDKDMAEAEYEHILNVALTVLYEDSKDLEKAIKAIREREELTEFFHTVVLH